MTRTITSNWKEYFLTSKQFDYLDENLIQLWESIVTLTIFQKTQVFASLLSILWKQNYNFSITLQSSEVLGKIRINQ